jgi:hypothetical protein
VSLSTSSGSKHTDQHNGHQCLKHRRIRESDSGTAPTVPPANCTNLGQQIQSIADPRLVFTSSITHHNISFTPQTPGATELGYYQLAAGETITYQPQTFQCSTGTCSPAVTFNFLFTPTDISAVNGINSSLGIVATGGSWNPAGPAANRWFGQNADLPGVYGWAATNCTNSAGFPNPAAGCPAERRAGSSKWAMQNAGRNFILAG